VLVDEGHRSHGGETHERMRHALPNAAYLAFTGTPLLRAEKTANKFGPIIHAYSMQRAVDDETVVPLLYEERVPELTSTKAPSTAGSTRSRPGFPRRRARTSRRSSPASARSMVRRTGSN